jgi:hypothetical protein
MDARNFMCSACLRVLFLLVCVTSAIGVEAQVSNGPFSEKDVMQLLTGGVSPKRVIALVQERKIDFQLDDAKELKFRRAGANDSLISVLKETQIQPLQVGLYKCKVPPCQKALFESAMKRIAANPADAEAYFNLATGMCPNLISGLHLPGGKPNCPDGPVQAVKQYLELAPDGRWATLAKKCLAAMGEPENPRLGERRFGHKKKSPRASAALAASSATNADVGMQANQDLPKREGLTGMIDGVYVGLRHPVETGTDYGRVEYDFLLFSPDGKVMNTLPQEGLDGVNLAAFFQSQPWAHFGAYSRNGDRIEIQWYRPIAERWSVTHNDQGADPRFDQYIPVCRCNGARLSGTYVYGKQGLQFSADGKFLDYGAIDSLLSGVGYPRPGRGSYRIQNFTLYLSYDDGRQLRRSFAAPAVEEGHGAFHWIIISGRLLYEQNYQRQLYQRTPSGLNPSNRR